MSTPYNPKSKEIRTCPGVGRFQAFRLGEFRIGYGETRTAAVKDFLRKVGMPEKRVISHTTEPTQFAKL